MPSRNIKAGTKVRGIGVSGRLHVSISTVLGLLIATNRLISISGNVLWMIIGHIFFPLEESGILQGGWFLIEFCLGFLCGCFSVIDH